MGTENLLNEYPEEYKYALFYEQLGQERKKKTGHNWTESELKYLKDNKNQTAEMISLALIELTGRLITKENVQCKMKSLGLIERKPGEANKKRKELTEEDFFGKMGRDRKRSKNIRKGPLPPPATGNELVRKGGRPRTKDYL